MRLKQYILILFVLLYGVDLAAIPARIRQRTLTQPDGYSFVALLQGDEWNHTRTTLDGCSIIYDADGYYSYARYDADGRIFSSGVHVGADAPAEVIAESRRIPYEQKTWLAARRRNPINTLWNQRPNIIRRLNALHPETKAGGSVTKHGIIILANFKKLNFTYTKADFENIIKGAGDATALAYFNDQFGGRYDFQFDIFGPVNLPEEYSYYGANDSDGNDALAHEMIIHACDALDAQVDFSKYDDDGDGEIDNVFVFYAGEDAADQASEDHVWSHQWYVFDGAGEKHSYDGKLLNNYACTSELMVSSLTGRLTMASIGTFCHEYTHTFGLPDYYDSDYKDSGGVADGIWSSLALMCAANMNNDSHTPPNYNALERMELGLSDPVPLTAGNYTLEPIQNNGLYYIVYADDPNEYYLIECRNNKGWDAYLNGSGMLIYHVDKSDRNSGYSTGERRNVTAAYRWDINEVNARPDHQCADLVEADATITGIYASTSWDGLPRVERRAFWPYGDVTSFTSVSTPAFTFWSGAQSTLALTNIARSGENVTFTVIGDAVVAPPYVRNVTKTVFQDAAIISWEASAPDFDGEGIVRYGKSGGALTEVKVQAYESGKYAVVLEGLEPSTAYQVRLLFALNGIEGRADESAKFTTASRKSGAWPYIWVESATRTLDGVFARNSRIPLRLYNIEGAQGVNWTFDGSPVAVGADGWYTVTRSGALKAVVTYPDGTTDVMLKNIVVN